MSKKYNIPIIEIKFFFADTIVTASDVQESYIAELEQLRQDSKYQAKQQEFADLLEFK
jgi:hypothetical protein